MRSTPLSWQVQPIFEGAVNKHNMAGIFYNNVCYLALNYYGNDAPVNNNNVVMVLDMQTREWSPPWYLSVSGFAEMNGELYAASSEEGQIYKLTTSALFQNWDEDLTFQDEAYVLDDTFTWDDADFGDILINYLFGIANIISVAVLPPNYTPMGATVKKRFVELQVAVAADSDTSNLELEPSVDSVSRTLTTGATSGWNGKRLSPAKRIQLPPGYEYQLTLTDNSTADWIIPKLITLYERGE